MTFEEISRGLVEVAQEMDRISAERDALTAKARSLATRRTRLEAARKLLEMPADQRNALAAIITGGGIAATGSVNGG